MEPAGLIWSVVTESPKMPRMRAPANPRHRARLHAEALEEGRLGDIRRLRPVVRPALRRGHVLPQLACPRPGGCRAAGRSSGPSRTSSSRRPPGCSARCHRSRRLRRPCPCPAARSSGPSAPCPRSRRPPPAAARRGSCRAGWRGCALRNCGCRRAPRSTPGRSARWPRRSAPPAARHCRCRWCSRSRRGRSPAAPDTAAARRAVK